MKRQIPIARGDFPRKKGKKSDMLSPVIQLSSPLIKKQNKSRTPSPNIFRDKEKDRASSSEEESSVSLSDDDEEEEDEIVVEEQKQHYLFDTATMSVSTGLAALGIAYFVFKGWNNSPTTALRKLIAYFDGNNAAHQEKARKLLHDMGAYLGIYLRDHIDSISQEKQQLVFALIEYIDLVKDGRLSKEILEDIVSSAERIN